MEDPRIAELQASLHESSQSLKREMEQKEVLLSEVAELKRRIEDLEREVEDKTEDPRVATLEEERDSLKAEVAAKDEEVTKTNSTIAEMIMKTTQELDELLESQEQMAKELEASKAENQAIEKKVTELTLKMPFFLSNSKNQVEAPTGHVTLVFTDVQSSTLQWEHRPVAMAAALSIHNKLMRKMIGDYSGYEVKTEGDAFMVRILPLDTPLRL